MAQITKPVHKPWSGARLVNMEMPIICLIAHTKAVQHLSQPTYNPIPHVLLLGFVMYSPVHWPLGNVVPILMRSTSFIEEARLTGHQDNGHHFYHRVLGSQVRDG